MRSTSLCSRFDQRVASAPSEQALLLQLPSARHLPIHSPTTPATVRPPGPDNACACPDETRLAWTM